MIVHDLTAALGESAVSTDPDDLMDHAQDWWVLGMLRKRRGDELTLPECVVRPQTVGQVAAVLEVATAHGVPVVPFGGGSGVCGAAQAVAGAVVLDTRRFDRIVIDEQALTVRTGAGVIGSELETVLNESGLTLGHFPQSIAISTVGGWLATRSAGQKSNRYGRIDEMVIGLVVVLPDGSVIELPARPATSAGPDLTRLFLGSEGTLGVMTEATLRVRPAPSHHLSAGFRFDSFVSGLRALQALSRAGLAPAVTRLYDETDAWMSFRDHAPGGAPLIVRLEGDDVLSAESDALDSAVAAAGGALLGPTLADRWWEHRNDAVGTIRQVIFDGLLGPTAVADTMEVAVTWPVDELYHSVRDALSQQADLVGCHASHVDRQGACLYFTFAMTGSPDDSAVEERYLAAWQAGMEATVDVGGTITHHHGVGLLRTPWIDAELGTGAKLLRLVKQALDPSGIMNPGKLIG